MTPRIGIVGGGPGGLMAAYLLQRRLPAAAVTIFEAAPRLGGKILTRAFQSAPLLYEAGAAELYDYSASGPDPLRELIAELGLTTRPLRGGPVVIGERVLGSRADVHRELGPATWRALERFRREAREAVSPQDYYESDWREDNSDPQMLRSFRDLLAAVEDRSARRYIEVAVHSDLATEPELTSAAYGLQNYLMDEPDYMQLYTIDGGIERLPRELVRRLSVEFHVGQRVTRVERTTSSRYAVSSRAAGHRHVEEFDFVVVALPNYWLPSVEWGGPTLADAIARHHDHYNYPAHYLRVSLLFARPFWSDTIDASFFMLDAFGGCCVYDESSRTPGVERGALGWLLAGEQALSLSNLTDEALIERVLDSVPAGLGPAKELFLEGRVHRWVGAVSGLPGGRPLVAPELRHRPEPVDHPRLLLVGDYLFDSTINGVLDSAEFVVDWIEEEVARQRAAADNATAERNDVVAEPSPAADREPAGTPSAR